MKHQTEEDDDNYSDEEVNVAVSSEDSSDQSFTEQVEKANSILSGKSDIDEESFKFFAELPAERLTKLIGKLSKDRSEKLMNYLSKTQDHHHHHHHHHSSSKSNSKKSDESVFKRPQLKSNKIVSTTNSKPSNFFNPSAPVWSDNTSGSTSLSSQSSAESLVTQRKQHEESVNFFNQLLLKHEESENLKIGKDSSYLYRKKNRKFRLEPSEYGFEELSRFHECPAESATCFPFYSVVAKVMYSSGDHLKGEQRAIEMMHSQIEEMLKVLFDRKLISKLIRLAKPNSQHLLYELDEDSAPNSNFNSSSQPTFVFPKSSKPIKKCFNLYFQAIFAEQYRVYQQFRETYQGIKEEGTFYKHNNNNDKTNSLESQNKVNQENEQDSDDNEIEVEEDEEENKEDHQLREMKDHFDRDEDDDDDNENNNNSSQASGSNKLSSGSENTRDPATVAASKKKKSKSIFYDMNEDDDDEEEVIADSEEARETLDTIEQIEKIANFDEEGAKHSSSSVLLKDTPVASIQANQHVVNKSQIAVELNNEKLLEQQLEERIRFNNLRIDEMDNSEWNYFMHIRSMTFSSGGNKKAFLEFLNVNRMNGSFQDTVQVFLPFVGYCLCKTIGIVVESILRERNSGKLASADTPITEREVQQFGNNVIEKYISRAKKYVFSKDKLIKLAFSLFSQEFHDCGYDRILKIDKQSLDSTTSTNSIGSVVTTATATGNVTQPAKATSTKTRSQKAQEKNKEIEEQSQQQQPMRSEVNLREQWKSLKTAYKKMWVERVIAEGQVKRFIDEKLQQLLSQPDQNERTALQALLRLDSSQVSFINKYASYLYERALEDLQKGSKNIEFAQHFKNWFLNNDSQRTGVIKKAAIQTKPQETRDTRRKQIKFESILD